MYLLPVKSTNFRDIKHLYLQPFPVSATTLHFEFYAENPSVAQETSSASTTTTPTSSGGSGSAKKTAQTNLVTYIHIENVDKLGKTPAQIMNDLLKVYNVPQDRQVLHPSIHATIFESSKNVMTITQVVILLSSDGSLDTHKASPQLLGLPQTPAMRSGASASSFGPRLQQRAPGERAQSPARRTPRGTRRTPRAPESPSS